MAISGKIIREIYQKTPNSGQFFKEFGEIVMDEFSDITLIGEIERKEGKDTFETLRGCLHSIFGVSARFNFNYLETEGGHSRAVMSLYLVWTGIFSFGQEKGHEFWEHVFEGLGHHFEPNQSVRCGKLFMRSLRENDLEAFEEVQEGHIYLTRILLHGLIPERHMEKFIRDFILDSLNQPKGLYETGHTLIAEWLKREFNVPKPIKRFLQYGRRVNVDLVERFIEMAKSWEEDNPSTWWQWKLPQYMVDSFRACIEKSPSQVMRRYKKVRFGEKPYLIFDYARENQPIIILPSQKTEGGESIEISYKDLRELEKEIKEEKTLTNMMRWVGNTPYSEQQELKVGPSAGWQISIGNTRQYIDYAFPEGNSENKVPVFIFEAVSGKALKVRRDKSVAGEIIAIYPGEAALTLSGGIILIEPLGLSGKWRDWQYVSCTLDEKGSFQYKGPNIEFKKIIEETISFRRFDQEKENPFLMEEKISSAWLRCNDDMPIILNPPSLCLCFPDITYRFWRRAVARLRRLDLPVEGNQGSPFRVSDAKKSENGWVVNIPEIERILPGVYEITIKGAIGVEDLKLPFVYLPIINSQRILSNEKMPIALEFLLQFSENITIQPLENTLVDYCPDELNIRVSPKEDQGDAYCALRIFHQTAWPIVLLLERSDIRWVRHNETEHIEWRYWRTRPEAIPIQRVQEIQDSRALVEISLLQSDQTSRPMFTSIGKLKIALHGLRSLDTTRVFLMSYEASRVKRRLRNIWLIDLKQFSDQLRDLQGYQRADILIDCGPGGNNPVLFTLLRYPQYKNFAIQPPGIVENSEIIRVTWDEHSNEPRRNRVLKIYPLEHPERVLFHPIPDGQRPPLIISLEPVEKAAPWVAQIDLVEGRFQMSRSNRGDETPQIRWLRIPRNWHDWINFIDFAASSLHEQSKYLTHIESISSNINLQTMPWTYFLYIFHRCKTKSSYQEMKNLLGEKIIEQALPLTKGKYWEIRSNSKKCLTLQIRSSSVDFSKNGIRCFEGCTPSQWCFLPKESEFELIIDRSSKYMGRAGTVWRLCQLKTDPKPLMISEKDGILEIGYWIKDVIGEGEKGLLRAQLPLVELWDKGPHFPLLDNIKLRDAIFVMEDKETPFGSKLSKLQPDKEPRKIALDLMNHWNEWSQITDVNPLLRRMIKGRFKNSRPDILSGTLALISRLLSAGFIGTVVKGGSKDSSVIKRMENLLGKTQEFVKHYLPQAFLRDLILSEILITWYWNKSIFLAERPP